MATGSGTIATLALLALLAIGGCGDGRPGIPDRTVVLTFDDGVRNHLTLVAPLLEEHGFGATFCISNRVLTGPETHMTWPEIADLARRGFEIANHTRDHMDFSRPHLAALLPADTAWMDEQFQAHGIPAPTCFAWPGSGFGPEALRFLREQGYRFARRGMRPEMALAADEPGPVYDPARHDPLLIPSSEILATWTLDRLRETVRRAKEGRAVVLQFHGIPDPSNPGMSVTPELFRTLLDELRTGDYRVVALRDLAAWVDTTRPIDDPFAMGRWHATASDSPPGAK